jgi:predicted TIM-barrel fold metal-dependent hydrolase
MTSFRFVDVHHHFIPDFYVDAIGPEAIGRPTIAGVPPAWSEEGALQTLDRVGIDLAFVSISTPGLAADKGNGATALLARRCNDFAAELRSRHLDRFGIIGSIPMSSISEALGEVRRLFDDLQVNAVCLMSNYKGHYLGDDLFRPLFEELDRRRAVVFVHPTYPEPYADRYLAPGGVIEFPFDTTKTIVSLVLSGSVTRYSNVRFVFPHAGGTLPFLANRITLAENDPAVMERVPGGILNEFRKLYFDIALSANPTAFNALRDIVPIDHILFGTDFPFGRSNQPELSVAGLNRLALPPEDFQRVARSNALKLFGVPD